MGMKPAKKRIEGLALCHTRITARSNAMRTTTRIIIHQLLPFSSESRKNLRIRRIASPSLSSVRSTFCSRSVNILQKDQFGIPRMASRLDTHSLCSPISWPIKLACCAMVFKVPEIESIVWSCSRIIIYWWERNP